LRRRAHAHQEGLTKRRSILNGQAPLRRFAATPGTRRRPGSPRPHRTGSVTNYHWLLIPNRTSIAVPGNLRLDSCRQARTQAPCLITSNTCSDYDTTSGLCDGEASVGTPTATLSSCSEGGALRAAHHAGGRSAPLTGSGG